MEQTAWLQGDEEAEIRGGARRLDRDAYAGGGTDPRGRSGATSTVSRRRAWTAGGQRLSQVSARRAPDRRGAASGGAVPGEPPGWSVAHFHDVYGERHAGERSYTWVRNRLQEARLVAKGSAAGRRAGAANVRIGRSRNLGRRPGVCSVGCRSAQSRLPAVRCLRSRLTRKRVVHRERSAPGHLGGIHEPDPTPALRHEPRPWLRHLRGALRVREPARWRTAAFPAVEPKPRTRAVQHHRRNPAPPLPVVLARVQSPGDLSCVVLHPPALDGIELNSVL